MRLRLAIAFLLALALLEPAVASGQSGGGEANPGQEIIGGEPADPGEFPFQVAILHHGTGDRWANQFCGGTLISPDTVMTAGHCVVGSRARDIDVLAGTIYLRPGGGMRVRARRIHLHPGYSDTTLANDIAIIQLAQELPYDPIDVVQPGEEALWTPGTPATTVGWGDTNIVGDVQHYPHRLRHVDVPVVSDEDCLEAYPNTLIAAQMVCAGDQTDGGEDSCYGDSGGPLMVLDTDRWVQIGVVSTGRGCARRNFPGIYSEVLFHHDFIQPFLDPDDVPDPPRRLRSRPVTEASVRLAWDESAFDGGTAITQYRIDLPDLDRHLATAGSQRHVRLRDLPPGHHKVWVRAVNVLGASAPRQIFVDV